MIYIVSAFGLCLLVLALRAWGERNLRKWRAEGYDPHLLDGLPTAK
jgi:hypothetical protein